MLLSLFETVEDALKSAVDAGKDRSDTADAAFATAEEELDWYAAWHHPKQQWVPLLHHWLMLTYVILEKCLVMCKTL